MKILLVEDDFHARKLARRILEEYGDCDFAMNGIEAFDAFKTAFDAKDPYSLICLDIMMPNMSGHEALKKIRAYENSQEIKWWKGTKVIMMTAFEDRQNRQKSFSEHADSYITKPIDESYLEQELDLLGFVKRK